MESGDGGKGAPENPQLPTLLIRQSLTKPLPPLASATSENVHFRNPRMEEGADWALGLSPATIPMIKFFSLRGCGPLSVYEWERFRFLAVLRGPREPECEDKERDTEWPTWIGER